MLECLKGKKLLIIGGAFQHCKLVEAAKELGIITYVTDYLPLEKAPAKRIADHYLMYNLSELDEIVDFCIREKIDGVIATSLDACQKPYQQICEKLGVPCFGTKEQYDILTDKKKFKEFCRRNGVDVIEDYSIDDFEDYDTCSKKVSFPVLVKPNDSRGSRGQVVCNTYEEVLNAIPIAQKESLTNAVVVEKYMGQKNDFSMTILVINRRAYVFRSVDRFLGKKEDGLDKLAVGAGSPSVFTNLYVSKVHEKVERLLADIGIENAPVFMQGFVDEDTIRFYDPGLRLPGGEYERMFERACGKNILYPLIEYSLTGKISEGTIAISEKDIWLNGKVAGQILPALKSGRISFISGMEKIKKHPCVVSVFERYVEGDVVATDNNVNRRFCEIDIVCDDNKEMKEIVEWIYAILTIQDDKGENMIISKYDINLWDDRVLIG